LLILDRKLLRADLMQRRAYMKPNHFHQILIVIPVVLALSVAAAEFYPVRELFAALVIFAVLFGTFEMALLIVFLVEETALKAVTHLESLLTYVRAEHAAAPSRPGGNSP
jgi:hypothetical protein